MNLIVLAVIAVLYVVIGVMSAVRSYRYLKAINPVVAGMPLVVGLCEVGQVALWPILEPVNYLVLKRVAPHLLPPPKVKPPKPLERIASALETVLESLGEINSRLLNDLEYLRQRISGLEQSNRDLRYSKDAIAQERDEANRSVQRLTGLLTLRNLAETPPPAPVPPPPSAPDVPATA